jgi:hypothetical protein
VHYGLLFANITSPATLSQLPPSTQPIGEPKKEVLVIQVAIHAQACGAGCTLVSFVFVCNL